MKLNQTKFMLSFKNGKGLQWFKNGYLAIRNYFLTLDHILLLMTYILVIIGMIFVFSASMYQTNSNGTNEAVSLVFSQFRAVIIGSLGLFLMPLIPSKWYRSLPLILTISGSFMLMMLYTALFEEERGGAANWLSIGGFSFQPSELSKLALIALFAWYASFSDLDLVTNTVLKIPSLLKQPSETLNDIIEEIKKEPLHLISFIILSMTLIALLKMPDYGTILIIGLILILIFGHSWFSKKGIAIIYGILMLGYLMLRLVSNIYGPNLIASGNYGKARIGIFTNPFIDELGSGYQIIQSLTAFSNGGLFGKGLGKGLVKRNHLPAAHTDFIFSIMGEEVGLIGISIFLIFFFFLMIYILKIATTLKDSYRRHLTMGIAIMFLVQSIVNIGGALSLLPLTGVTLPFISYGGTSIMVSLIAIGVVEAMFIHERNEEHSPLVINNNRTKTIPANEIYSGESMERKQSTSFENEMDDDSLVDWSDENGI